MKLIFDYFVICFCVLAAIFDDVTNPEQRENAEYLP